MSTDTQLEDARISRVDGTAVMVSLPTEEVQRAFDVALERARHVLDTVDVEIESREGRTYFRADRKLLTP
jgi:hypothetical protein